MTTTFILVRHAAHDNVGGFLAGRMAGVHLGSAGLAQAERLAERLRRERVDAMQASPRDRTRETAAAIARGRGIDGADMPVEVVDDLDEVAFGRWSGQVFEALNTDPLWRQWNEARAVTRTPGGETMLDVQRRIIGHVERMGDTYPEGVVALVTHADPIKMAVAYYLGLGVESWSRFEIAPASISTLVVGAWGARLHGLNEVVW